MMSQRKQQKPINDKAIIPMSIHQIQNQLKNDVTFENQNFHTISIVARLASFRKQTRFNILLFTDGTNCIEGQINTQNGKMPSYAENIPFDGKIGDYFFIVLKPKIGQETRKFYIHMIKQIKNYNQISKHMSDIVLSHLIRTKH